MTRATSAGVSPTPPTLASLLVPGVRPRKLFKYFEKDQRQAIVMRSDMDDSPP
jgi:hypothetical protein